MTHGEVAERNWIGKTVKNDWPTLSKRKNWETEKLGCCMKSPICSCTEVQWKKMNVCTNVHSEIVTNLSDTMCASSGPTRRIHLRRGMVQFSSVAQSCPTLCDPMDHSTPGLPVYHQLLESTQTHVHPTISSSVIPFSSCLQSFPTSGSFPMSQFFVSSGQTIGVSALCIKWPK